MRAWCCEAPPSRPSRGPRPRCYVGLSGPDARTLHRVTLDANGKETERTNLYKWTARQNPQACNCGSPLA